MYYTKLPLSIPDQIAALEHKGMIFSDKLSAAHYLAHISYYRLRAYTYPYQNNQHPDHPFWQHTPFERILNDYILDRKLRIIIFDALEKIEIALRTQIIYQYSMVYGGQWYEDPIHYHHPSRFQSDLNRIDKEISRSQEEFIKHFKRKYTSSTRPPAWMALEVSSLGTLSKVYDNLKMIQEKKLVARHFGLAHPPILVSWMRTFSYVRNICAHHSRLWNRQITITPVLPLRLNDPWINSTFLTNSHNIFTTLCCIRFFLNRISPSNNFSHKIQELLHLFPNTNLQTMGFLPNWEKEPLWR